MKVLWFEVTIPGRYKNESTVLGGWQDSLENIVRTCDDIELYISFEGTQGMVDKSIEGVHYIPIIPKQSTQKESKACNVWTDKANSLIPVMQEIVKSVEPDVIHVFGTEWVFGLIANYVSVPVVIHIQGAIVPYNNAMFPPGLSLLDYLKSIGLMHPRTLMYIYRRYKEDISREQLERKVWSAVSIYMGRTRWDKALSEIMHPGRTYYHVDEALRSIFLNSDNNWVGSQNEKLILFSTGFGDFRKGLDMLLKTASIIKHLGVSFEWRVAGYTNLHMKKLIEKKVGYTLEECNIIPLGILNQDELFAQLAKSSIYVHAAYAENSPNSICEAQCIGLPVISTNVGGISTLVGESGILVPANDPWSMAYEILELYNDSNRMKQLSEKAKLKALFRHNPENIKNQLLDCYYSIINKEQ